MHWLRAQKRPASTWKNGGGSTHEIATFPPGATLDTFDWRLSIAQVEANGPFSHFAGIDRTLAVITPGAIRLTSDTGSTIVLDQDSGPYAFSGETPIDGHLLGSAISDLNLMTRRSRHLGALKRRVLRHRTKFGERYAHTIVVALDPVTVGDGELGSLDAGWLEPGQTASFAPHDKEARVLVAQVWAKPDPAW